MSYDSNPATGHQTTTTPATEPDAIRAEIERTRSDLSRDVNALGEAVSPGSIAKRQTNKAVTMLKPALKQGKPLAVGLVALGAAWLLGRYWRSHGRSGWRSR
jgi:hypothetical protein